MVRSERGGDLDGLAYGVGFAKGAVGGFGGWSGREEMAELRGEVGERGAGGLEVSETGKVLRGEGLVKGRRSGEGGADGSWRRGLLSHPCLERIFIFEVSWGSRMLCALTRFMQRKSGESFGQSDVALS